MIMLNFPKHVATTTVAPVDLATLVKSYLLATFSSRLPSTAVDAKPFPFVRGQLDWPSSDADLTRCACVCVRACVCIELRKAQANKRERDLARSPFLRNTQSTTANAHTYTHVHWSGRAERCAGILQPTFDRVTLGALELQHSPGQR